MSYDDWKTSAPEQDDEPPTPCPICTGHEDAEPCSEDCAMLCAEVRLERVAKRYEEARRTCVELALKYRTEFPAPDHRVQECLARAREYRYLARQLRGAA